MVKTKKKKDIMKIRDKFKLGKIFNSKDDMNIISKYLQEIDEVELLTRDQEKECARLMQQGDENAREKLIKANLRFVVMIARHYRNNSIPLIDLINEGNMGLILATKHYDYRKGFHFISYAVWWIRWAIRQALTEQSSLIRLPMTKASKIAKINELMQENNGYTQEDIKSDFKLDNHELESLLAASKSYKSFETPIKNENQDLQLGDVIKDNESKAPDFSILDQGLKDCLNESLCSLPERERIILKYRYGLDGHRELTLREIAKQLNMTKEGIRQIQNRALEHLRNPIRANKLKDFVYNN